jgi:hypothetical protein
VDFLANHVWKIQEKVWSARQQGEKAIGRMYFVHPTIGERLFLHLLLTVVPGVTSFEHFRTIDDIEHLTFQADCEALGLLQDDTKWDMCMWEAYIDQDAKKLKNIFVTLLLFYSPLNLEVLCERYRNDISHNTWHQCITNGGTCQGCLQRHPTTPRGQISVDEQRLARLSGNAAHFVTRSQVTG